MLFLLFIVGSNGQRFELQHAGESQSEVPTPRYGAAMESFAGGTEVVLFGGRTNSSALSDTWIFAPASNHWTQVTGPGPSARFDALGVGINFGNETGEQMYLIGGRNMATVINSSLMWVFDLSSRKWDEVAVQTEIGEATVEHVLARSAAAGGRTELGSIIVSHGMSSREVLSDTYLITLQTRALATIETQVSGASRTFEVGDPRALYAGASAMTPANELVISGGCYQTGLCPNQDVWALDVSQREWRYLSRGPSPREFGSLAQALPSMASESIDTRQTVVLWGGRERSKQTIYVDEATPNEVDVLDVRNRKWQREMASDNLNGTLATRFGSNMVVIGNGSVNNEFRYFIFGGAGNDGSPIPGNLILQFDPDKLAKVVTNDIARVQSYLYVHGIIMWIAFGLLLPTGSLTARYLRVLSSSSKWFILHGTAQSAGGILAWTGLIFGIIGANDKPVHAHAIFGSIVMALMSCQIISGTPCIRSNPNAGVKRQVWSIFHNSIGWSVTALGLFNCVAGMILLVLPVGTWISMLVAISVLLAIALAFEIRRLSRRDHKASRYTEDTSSNLPKLETSL